MSLIDIHPSGRVCQRADADKVGRALRRGDVDHIEGDFDGFLGLIGRGLREPRLLRAAVDGNQVVMEIEMRVVALHVLHQRRYVVGNAEQNAARIVKVDVDVLEVAVSVPMVSREIHRLLRSAGALDRHRWLGENGAA